MKKVLEIIAFFLIISQVTFAQTTTEQNDYGWSKRISFMVGAGISYITTDLYLDPAIDKTNNAVIVEKADKFKPNLSLGIVYTPYVATVQRPIRIKEATSSKIDTLYEYYPRGISFALFLNPISISKLSETSLTNTVDLGLGIGYRSGSFSVFATCEFFSIRQPKDYFIDQYKNNNKPYVINGQTQTSISNDDNDIFRSKVVMSFGIKLAYTFDIVKSFYQNSSSQK
jgi:hypothetical protein